MGDIAGGTYVEDEKQRQKDLQNLASGATTSLSGPGTGILNISGTQEARQGGLEGLQMGQLLYGQGMADVGKEAADYSGAVKGRLGQDSVNADVYRQQANQRLAQQAAKSGLGGTNQFGAQEQLYRQSGMQAAAMNQEYKDKALALYGRNIGAKQSGLSSLYLSGKGVGQANAPTPTPSSGGGCAMCIIATNMFLNREIDKKSLLKIYKTGKSFDESTFIGYLIIANLLIKIKNGFFVKKIMIPAFISYADKKPNIFAKISILISKIVGNMYSKTNSSYHLKIMKENQKNYAKMKRIIEC